MIGERAKAVLGEKPMGKLPAEGTQARRFGKTRSAQSTALHEDYVELIADLLEGEGEARPTDIARRLGVSHATAIKSIARLKRAGLATARPYRGVFLTEKGRALAKPMPRASSTTCPSTRSRRSRSFSSREGDLACICAQELHSRSVCGEHLGYAVDHFLDHGLIVAFAHDANDRLRAGRAHHQAAMAVKPVLGVGDGIADLGILKRLAAAITDVAHDLRQRLEPVTGFRDRLVLLLDHREQL